jgi:hypothetical protein
MLPPAGPGGSSTEWPLPRRTIDPVQRIVSKGSEARRLRQLATALPVAIAQYAARCSARNPIMFEHTGDLTDWHPTGN